MFVESGATYSFAYESIWCGIVGYNVSDKTKM